MKTILRSTRPGAGRAALALLLVVAVLGSSAVVQASFPPLGGGLPPIDEGWSPGDSGGTLTPPRAPIDGQQCMNDLLANQQRCKDIHCTWILWIEVVCNDYELAYCNLAAKQVFVCCMSGGLDCAGA